MADELNRQDDREQFRRIAALEAKVEALTVRVQMLSTAAWVLVAAVIGDVMTRVAGL